MPLALLAISDEIPEWLAKAGMSEESSGHPFCARYSPWVLGPLADPDPEFIARFKAIEKELIEMSERTAQRRYYEMEEASVEDADLLKEVFVTETHNHFERVKCLQSILYQMQHGADF